MTNHRPVLSAVPALLLAGMLSSGLAACGSEGGGSADHGTMGSTSGGQASPSPTTPAALPSGVSEQDVSFAQMMIVHHREAVEMAELATERAGSAQVKQLAARIQAAQSPEISTMTGWLGQWGASVPAPMPAGESAGEMAHDPSAHGSTSMESMPGAMTAAEMSALRAATGESFDRQFLTMMIRHHAGALTMAQAQADQGSVAEVKAFAEKVVTDQTAEITEMRGMLAAL